MEDMETAKAIGRHYRNRIIGDYLKELKFTEGRSTGLSKILKAMERNGSPKPTFESVLTWGSLIVTIPVHEAFLNSSGSKTFDPGSIPDPSIVNEQKIPYLSTTKTEILGFCLARSLSATEISKKLKWSSKKGNLKEKLLQLIDTGDLEYTIPEKPESRLQKYRVTSKGYTRLRKEVKRQLLHLQD